MQLADQSSIESIRKMGKTLSNANTVLHFIKHPQTVSRGSGAGSGVVRDDFPLTLAACNGKHIRSLKEEKRMGLKLTLAEDLSPLFAEVDAAVNSEKRFNAEVLPTDPAACMARMGELKADVKRKIDDLQRELETLEGGEFVIQNLQRVQTQATRLAAELDPGNKRQCL
jgi:hypothetical protein